MAPSASGYLSWVLSSRPEDLLFRAIMGGQVEALDAVMYLAKGALDDEAAMPGMWTKASPLHLAVNEVWRAPHDMTPGLVPFHPNVLAGTLTVLGRRARRRSLAL